MQANIKLFSDKKEEGAFIRAGDVLGLIGCIKRRSDKLRICVINFTSLGLCTSLVFQASIYSS